MCHLAGVLLSFVPLSDPQTPLIALCLPVLFEGKTIQKASIHNLLCFVFSLTFFFFSYMFWHFLGREEGLEGDTVKPFLQNKRRSKNYLSCYLGYLLDFNLTPKNT